MSLLTDASLIVTPNAYKEGKLYSLKPTDGSGDLGVVRATTATYVDADGVIQTALANQPRLDYTNGSCPSILIEPQRTNLVFPSATATTQTRTVTAVAHTLSFYGTGSVVLSGVATGTLVGTGTSNRVTLTFTPTAGSLILTVVGSVTNWQLEAGANATSYIPTTTTSVTRNSDVISKSGISSLIGQAEGTVFFDLKEINNKNDFNSIMFSNGTDAFRFGITTDFTFTQLQCIYVSTQTFTSNVLTIPIATKIKIAIKYSIGELKFFANGSLISTFSPLNDFSVNNLSQFRTGRPAGGREFFGKIDNILLWKTKLTDQQCIELTTL